MNVFDRLPTWLQHLLIAFATPALGQIASDVISTGGISTIDWPHEVLKALDLGAVGAATAIVLLGATPLTRQYGIRIYSKNIPTTLQRVSASDLAAELERRRVPQQALTGPQSGHVCPPGSKAPVGYSER